MKKTDKTEKRELRNFGLVIGAVFGILGALFLWKEKSPYIYMLSVAFILVSSGIFAPKLLKYIYKIWMWIAQIMGWFMTRVIVLFLYYTIVTFIALLSRIMGKKFLELNIDKNCESYWNVREEVAFDKEQFLTRY